MNTTKPTFKEQYDKIVGAYLRNELNPQDGCACFVGNLLNNNPAWGGARMALPGTCFLSSNIKIIPKRDYNTISSYYLKRGKNCISKESGGLYTLENIIQLEENFLRTANKGIKLSVYTEDALFLAMESTLLMLKEIHESKGEVIEPYVFKKRELATV